MSSTTDTGTSSSSAIEGTDPKTIAQLEEEQALLKRIVKSNDFKTKKAFQGGAEGVIHFMVSETTDRTFIMKLTHARPVKQGFRYPSEAKVVSKLRLHRNIISPLDVVEDEVEKGRYKIWMEYCQGGDLFGQVYYWWAKHKVLVPEPFLLHLVVSLFDGLAFLHSGLRYDETSGQYTQDESHEQIVHGDLKLENIFLRWPAAQQQEMPDIVIGDFGAANPVNYPDPSVSPGTDCYHAPEDRAIYGNAKYGYETLEVFSKMVLLRKTPSDIWAAGQTLYNVATAELEPFPIGTNLSQLRFPGVYKTPGLRDFIVKCLQHDPAKRGTADFSNGTGLLPMIQTFRAARDAMIAKEPMSDPSEWRLPKPAR